MGKIKIDLDEQLQPGDVIELHYKTIGLTWLQAVQITAIEWRLKQQQKFELLSTGIQDNLLIITVRIKNPPVEEGQVQEAGIITAGVVIGTVAAVIGIVIWVTFEGAYKVTEKAGEATQQVTEALKSPAGSVLAIGGTAIVGALVVAALLRK